MSTLRRSDLFGYASQEQFAFTPSDRILADEEGYGGEDDLADVPLFGADDPDAQLDALEREMDAEQYGVIGRESGTDPSLTPIGSAGQFAPELGKILLDGFQEGLSSDSRMVQMAQRAGRSLADLVQTGDWAEMASAMLADPAFGAWNSLSEEEQVGLVKSAVAYTAIPGLEMSWDDAFAEAWHQGGIATLPSDVYTMLKVLFTQDGPKFVWSCLNEVPVLGAMLSGAGFTVENFDQQVNLSAMGLYLVGLYKPEVYRVAAGEVTERAQHIIAASQEGLMQAGGRGGLQGGMVIQEEALVSSIQLPEPAQTLPDQGIGLPDPPQILATGYGVAIAGALLGIFR